MEIDIDRLTEAELIDLNNRIVARLRFLSQMRAHAQMLDFKIGIGSRSSRRALLRRAHDCRITETSRRNVVPLPRK